MTELKQKLKEKLTWKLLAVFGCFGIAPPLFFIFQYVSEFGFDAFVHEVSMWHFAGQMLHSVLITVSASVVTLSVVVVLQVKHPWEKGVLKRLLLELLLTNAGVAAVMLLSVFSFIHFFCFNKFSFRKKYIAS